MPPVHAPPPARPSESDPYGSPLQFSGQHFGYSDPQQQGFQPAYDPAIYGTPQQEQAAAYPSEAYYDDPARLPQGEEAHEEDYGEERPRRGLKLVLLLAGLAVIGTSGVLGYRAFLSGGPSGPPPVIKANTTPSKIVPAPSAEASNKQIYDRVGDVSQGERIVSREEKPVEVKDNSRSSARTAFPGLPASSGPQDTAMAASPPLNTDPGGPMSAEPRKIRTVTIRPDQGGTGSTPAPRPNATPPAARTAAAAAPVAPVAAPAPAPTPARAANGVPTGNAPLSLSPQVASADASARPAFPPPPVAAPAPAAPTRLAAVPPAAEATSGAYTVQISSQRSETEAQASFRSLQAKFPNLLNDRQPIIRRADLGEKGIYFRAMVGPFTSADQATQFCGSLKSAGGQCVVQRN
ncbi:MAG TPA: SPOR domain-containing protein [Xanthobacteraceae bacterium]|nr:SPOR domain-containing protein [Xanthobacteraceae bacterium]